MKFTLAILLSYLTLFCSSQRDTSLSYYFDDDGISNAKNIIKFNPTTAIGGDWPVSFEKVLFTRVGAEIGVGMIMPYYLPSWVDFLSGATTKLEPTGGHSILMQLKIYTSQDAPTGAYYGLLYRRRKFIIPKDDFLWKDYVFNYGYQTIINGHFLIDYSVGVGFRFSKNIQTTDPNYQKESISNVAAPWWIRIGYLF